jgi:hypothetical protein
MIIDKKRHKGLQTYKEKGKDSYLLIDESNFVFENNKVIYFGKGPIIDLEINSIGDISLSRSYLDLNCYPVSWAKIPEKWQNKFREYI